MMGEYEVVEETVDLTDLSKFIFTSDFAKMWVEKPEFLLKDPHYPYRKLVDSIKQHGFQPNFPDRPYHGEIFGEYRTALVLDGRHGDGKFNVSYGGPHRMAAARMAGLNEIRCYVLKPRTYSPEQLSEFKEAAAYMEKHGNCKYQSWTFPGGSRLEGRDDSRKIFNSFNLPFSIFTGRSVLDIACNTGYFAVQAALSGASEIAGFDVAAETIEAASMIAHAARLSCPYEFQTSEFWDYPFDRAYDIVFCNQAMYHFTSRHRSKCLGTIDDMLDRIAQVTGRLLLMYTYVDVDDPPSKDGGYYPSSYQLTVDLIERGFSKVLIDQVYGPKKHVIAIKKYENKIAPRL